MKLELYKTHDADTVMNKTKELIYTFNVDLKATENITELTVPLYEEEGVDLNDINYAYIEEFRRYYFLRSYNVGPNKIYHLLLECDVIETYKEEILNSQANITRKIKEGDFMNISGNFDIRKEVDVYNSNKGFHEEETVILSTIGQRRRD